MSGNEAHPRHPSRSAGESLPLPTFAHLRRLTDERGIWEHALYSQYRREHGYCTDDNARALVVVLRQASGSEDLTDLADIYVRFVLDARTSSGKFHNRRDAEGVWIDDVGSDDCQGRAFWALGTAARLALDPVMREAAADAFATCATFESPHLRANAYAALGAADLAASAGRSPIALEFLDRTSATIAEAARAAIPWPEARLTYANARVPEALIAAGSTLGDRHRLAMGIRLLDWLVDTETKGDHFSFTPVGGRGRGESGPAFDQQPIEAWAMADAAHRAWSVTEDTRWRARAVRAASWLAGLNDTGAIMYDQPTGGTGDGLMTAGINENRGAESTIAGIGALQVAAALHIPAERSPRGAGRPRK